MLFTNGKYLTCMVFTMNQMEAPPLSSTQRTKHMMACTLLLAKGFFRVVAELMQMQ